MPGDDVPVVKATNCMLVGPGPVPAAAAGDALHPLRRMRQGLPGRFAAFRDVLVLPRQNFGKAQEYHLFDCIECGCCAYVCPSHIRWWITTASPRAKSGRAKREKEAADQARERFEFRHLREEREKQEKAAKLAAKTAAGREKARRRPWPQRPKSPRGPPKTKPRTP
jgi:electron transport complex protein RnfC